MKRCPSCRSTRRSRRKRKFLLKYMPFTKAYVCESCRARYIYIAPLDLSILMRSGTKK